MTLSVLMVTNNYPTPENPHMGSATALQEKGLKELGVKIDVAFFDRLRYGRSVYRGMRDQIVEMVRQKRSDIVHVQFGGISAVNAVQACGRRCVITFHGTDLHGGSPKRLIDKFSFKAGVIASKWAARRSGWNIAVSPELAERLAGVTARVSVIPTGVDYEVFRPIPRADAIGALGLDPSKKYVVFCDSMRAAVKRRELALAAMNYLRERGLNAELLELHRVPHSKVPLYLNASDALLVTSDKEGSPNIVKEAIATNLPIVSVAVGDVPERIAGIFNCRILPRNASEIGGALLSVLSSPTRADGRESKRNEIENLAVCKKILSVYQGIMSDMPSGPL